MSQFIRIPKYTLLLFTSHYSSRDANSPTARFLSPGKAKGLSVTCESSALGITGKRIPEVHREENTTLGRARVCRGLPILQLKMIPMSPIFFDDFELQRVALQYRTIYIVLFCSIAAR
jgi:hypothetical protein